MVATGRHTGSSVYFELLPRRDSYIRRNCIPTVLKLADRIYVILPNSRLRAGMLMLAIGRDTQMVAFGLIALGVAIATIDRRRIKIIK